MHADHAQRFFGLPGAVAISAALVLLLPDDGSPAKDVAPVEPRTGSGCRLTLDQCIGIALENQPAIRAQHAAMCAAVERRKIAGSYFLPQLDFHARYTNLDEPRSVDIPSPFVGDVGDIFSDAAAFFGIARAYGSTTATAALDNPNAPPFSLAKQAALDRLPDSWNVGLLGENSLTTEFLLAQPIWTGGKIRHRYEQAKLGISAASADVAKSKQETVFAVKRAYFGVQLAAELWQVMEDAIGHFRAIESLVQALLDEGDEYVTTVDVHRARTVRLLAQSERIRVEQAAEIAHEALRQAMGLEPQAQFEIAERNLTRPTGHVELPAILDEAMIRRPELAKARLGVQIAGLERQLAAAEYLPDVGLFGRFATIDDDGGFANPNDRQEWAVGLTVGVPLYAGGRRSAQKREADFQQAHAARLRQLARQLITLEVQKTYLEYVEMSDRLPKAERAAMEAEETLEGLRHQFLGDQIEDQEMPDYFEDLINARILRTLASTRYHDVVYQYNLSLAKIRLATASDEFQDLSDRSAPGTARVSDWSEPPRDGRGPVGSPALFERDGRRQ